MSPRSASRCGNCPTNRHNTSQKLRHLTNPHTLQASHHTYSSAAPFRILPQYSFWPVWVTRDAYSFYYCHSDCRKTSSVWCSALCNTKILYWLKPSSFWILIKCLHASLPCFGVREGSFIHWYVVRLEPMKDVNHECSTSCGYHIFAEHSSWLPTCLLPHKNLNRQVWSEQILYLPTATLLHRSVLMRQHYSRRENWTAITLHEEILPWQSI